MRARILLACPGMAGVSADTLLTRAAGGLWSVQRGTAMVWLTVGETLLRSWRRDAAGAR